jgi:hypothetical protein
MASDVPEAKWEAGKGYTLKGSFLNKILKAILRRTIIAGTGIQVRDVDGGTEVTCTAVGGGGTNANTFWRLYTTPGVTPHFKLQGGQVTPRDSGDSSVPDIDLGLASSPPADGHLVWLEITGDGNLSAGGRLYSGFKITSVSVETGTTIGTDTFPTKEDATGKKCHVRLGNWQGGVFHPDRAGSIEVGFCPGSAYGITRF